MKELYKSAQDAAKVGKAAKEKDRIERAALKVLEDDLKADLLAIAAEGKFSCRLVGVVALKKQNKSETLENALGEKETLQVDAELAQTIADRLRDFHGFAVESLNPMEHIISWSAPLKDKEPEPTGPVAK